MSSLGLIKTSQGGLNAGALFQSKHKLHTILGLKMAHLTNLKIIYLYFIDNPDVDPETSTPVDETEEFCGMFSTKLEGKNILLAAEMDGIISNKILDHSSEINWEKLEFVELKVKRRETNERQKNNFYRFKLIKWWCQSFLVGISKVYFGLRDDRGIVDEIDKMNVNDMPKMAKVCLNFFNGLQF